MEAHDLERRLEMGRLLDFYGPLITQRRLRIVRMYCDDDMSMAEIAQALSEAGSPVTRQGVYDTVVKTERQLADYEEKLGLMARYDMLISEARDCLAALERGEADEARAALRRMTEL